TSLKTSIKTITYLSDIGCLEIQGASLLPGNDRFNSVFIKHDRSLPAQRISLLHTEYTVLHLTMRLSKHLVIFIQGDKNRTMVKDFFKMILA
ncbi:MAG: hypothetical protein E6041_01315, partial [Escherichia coli]|nr:hypothetical protein [Escherichia coli]